MPRKTDTARNAASDAKFTRRYAGADFNEVACHPRGAVKPHWTAVGIDQNDARRLIEQHELACPA